MRCSTLGAMRTMLHYDEAYEALDAQSLITNPRFTPFFPGNFGRESGFMYWLLPFVWAFPGEPFGVRLAATMVGVLTLAATFKLARELLRKQGALWVMLALTTLYWHVHLSHLALRANFYVLVGTLSAAWLLEACRTNHGWHWMRAGITLGLLAYTYFASAAWIGYAGLLLGMCYAFRPERRRGVMWAGGVAVLLMLPMVHYIWVHPDLFFSRSQTVAAWDLEAIGHNVLLWLRAFFQTGDVNVTFNLPGRPILTPVQGLLFGIGLIALFFTVHYRWQLVWLGGWAVLSLTPSLLSNQAPHFLRGSGLTIAIAVVLGCGVYSVVRWLSACGYGQVGVVAVGLLFVGMGWQTMMDFQQRWLHDPQTTFSMEESLNRAIDFIRKETADEESVYFSPLSLVHPVIVYRLPQLTPRSVGAFDSHQCLVLTDRRAVYVSLMSFEPGFEARLGEWVTLMPLYTDPEGTYRITEAAPRSDDPVTARGPQAIFGDLIQILTLTPLPETVSPGETVTVVLGIRIQQPIQAPESLFVHLYGDPTPYAGGPLWAQADNQICTTYPAHLWRTDELLIQTFVMQLPASIPAGNYEVAAGIYPFPAGERYPLVYPEKTPYDYFVLKTLRVLPKQEE